MTTQHEHNKNRSTIKKQHHFSIRKLSGGIASIAIGATLFLGAGHMHNASVFFNTIICLRRLLLMFLHRIFSS